jgi:uncharacterized membrane protein
MNFVAILLRWLHIIPAVAAGGATLYAVVALLPSLGEMPEPERARLRDALARRWRGVFMASTALLLASGLLNFILFQAPVHKGQPLYHALFGVKFLAAMIVFFLGAALTGRSAGLAGIRAKAPFWTTVSALLVLAILLVSGVLRGIPHAP